MPFFLDTFRTTEASMGLGQTATQRSTLFWERNAWMKRGMRVCHSLGGVLLDVASSCPLLSDFSHVSLSSHYLGPESSGLTGSQSANTGGMSSVDAGCFTELF